jgi:hypothetical protein
MRRITLGLATLSLLASLATSCANETIETPKGVNNDNGLAFGVATGRQTTGATRAAEATIETLQAAGVTVLSYEQGKTEQQIFELAYAEGAWTYDNQIAHPAYTMAHFSVFPANAGTFVYNGSSATLEYNASTADADLMVANTTTTAESATATLNFKHILSQINFAIQGLEDAVITVKGIVLDVPATATYTFGTGWGAATGQEEFPYTPAVEAVASETDATIYLGNYSTTVTGESNGLMMIPQTLAEGATLSFQYSLTIGGVSPLTGTDSYGFKPVTIDLSTLTGGATAWEPSKRYLYTLSFSSTEYNRVGFNVTVTDPWTDETGANVNN